MKDSYTRSQDDFFKRFLDGIKYYVLLSIILGIVALILALLMAPMVGYFISAAYIAAIIIGLFLGGIIFFVMFALGEICVSLSDIQKTLSMNSAERQKDEEAKDEEDDSSESSSGKVKITAHTLNVYQGASRSSGILGTLSEGEVVAYSKAKNGWLQISFHGEEGWIMQEFTQTMVEM